MRKPAEPREAREPIPLDYRPRAAGKPRRSVRPVEWVGSSLVLGGLAWTTFALVWSPSWWKWLPLGLAVAGLALAVTASRRPLPRENLGGLGFAVFMNYMAVAMWLLSL